MRNLRRLAWAAVAAAATASPAAAQMGGGGGGGGGGGNGGGGNGGGNLGNFQTTTPTTSSTSSAAGGTAGGSSGTTGSIGGAELYVERAPIIRAPSTSMTTASGKVQATNFLAPTFAELRAGGTLTNARNASYVPGGFGNPAFGTTGTTATTTTTGRAGGIGGTGATGQTTDPGGQLVQLPRQIAYTAQLKFAVPPMPAPRLQADLRGVIDRAGLAGNPVGVQVVVDGNAVVLRGAVRDGDEARLVEGLVRLTPGVGRITNELTYAQP
ncbi:BON domain-containing protein [bacterium]|nr:BON domain-containing protein [bacterium]